MMLVTMDLPDAHITCILLSQIKNGTHLLMHQTISPRQKR